MRDMDAFGRTLSFSNMAVPACWKTISLSLSARSGAVVTYDTILGVEVTTPDLEAVNARLLTKSEAR